MSYTDRSALMVLVQCLWEIVWTHILANCRKLVISSDEYTSPSGLWGFNRIRALMFNPYINKIYRKLLFLQKIASYWHVNNTNHDMGTINKITSFLASLREFSSFSTVSWNGLTSLPVGCTNTKMYKQKDTHYRHITKENHYIACQCYIIKHYAWIFKHLTIKWHMA